MEFGHKSEIDGIWLLGASTYPLGYYGFPVIHCIGIVHSTAKSGCAVVLPSL
jgi:hypothetical protein